MSLTNRMAQYRLRLAYRRPTADRLRRIAVIKPRDNDIFVSYVAQDADFVRRLDKSIRDQGLDPWIDFDDIPDFNHELDRDTHYEQEIKAGILGADVFVLVLSKAALAAAQPIQQLKLAQRLNKLIILLCKELPDECDERIAFLDDLHYLDLSSPLVGRVFEQIALNIIHLQTYTRLLARATEWDNQGRPQQYLLTPEDLKAVKKQKRWIETHRLGNQFQFTSVQKIFLETVNKVHETSEYFGKSPPDIFVSYSRSNKHFVEKLSQALKNERWKVWIDRDRIPVAANWRDEAEEGIRYAHTIIFVICPESLRSKNCQWEFEKAKKYKKRIIPVVSHSEYNRDIFRAMGLASVQYVSFIRDNQSFSQSLRQLLDALKENLDDLKIYRRLLIKAYDWSERERSDGFLMSRDEYKEIQSWHKQRQITQNNDNREIEPLLSRQKEYIRASQRYLDSQRHRQGLALSLVLAISLGLAGLLVGKTLGEIRALVRSLDDLQGLDALMTGLKASKRVKNTDVFVKSLRPGLRAKATTALHRTTLNLREINRLEGHNGKTFSVVFSPDGQHMVSVGADNYVRFWPLDRPTQLGSVNEDVAAHQCKSDTNIAPTVSHKKPVVTAAYSSDGQTVATGDRDGVIKLWHCSGLIKKTLSQQHQGSINRVVFSPGSQYLASTGVDGQVFLWTREDSFSELIELEYEGDKPFSTVAFSPNGRFLAAATFDGQVYLWTIKGKLLQTYQYQGTAPANFVSVFKGDSIFTMRFSPDSSLLAFSGAKGLIQIQDLKNLKNKTGRLLSDHDGGVYQLAFSSDGATLASASEDGTIKLWEPRRDRGNELVHTLRGHQGPVYRVSFGPRDDVLATGGADGIVRLWLRDKGVQIEAFEGHEDEISSLEFSPKPTLGYESVLVSASDDGQIRLWNIDSPIHPFPHNSHVFDVTFRPDGRVIASGGVHNVRLWRPDGTLRSHIAFDKASDIQKREYKANDVKTVDYSPDNRLLAAGGSEGQIKVWEPEVNTAEPIQTLAAHLDGQGVIDLKFSPNGRWLASGGGDRTLKLWTVKNGSLDLYDTLKHLNEVTAVAFSRDSQLLVTATKADSDVGERGLLIWSVSGARRDSFKPKLKIETELAHEGSVLTIAMQQQHPQMIASGGVDGKINLWDASGKLLQTLDAHSDPVTNVAFSEDGLFLASSSRDGTVRVWTSQGDLISELERHSRAVSSVEFGPGSGDRLASSSLDEDVLLWELWDLSGVALTQQNQNREILRMLISSGCDAAVTFLATHHTEGKTSSDISEAQQEILTEINEVNHFCQDYVDIK